MKLFASLGPARVQYHGSIDTTQSCLDAVVRLCASGVTFNYVYLLTCEGRHAFLLDIGDPEPIAIRSGFTSGYSGEGPAGLAIALHLFHWFNVEVEEVLVDSKFLARIEVAQLSAVDVAWIREANTVRPIRIHDYMHSGLQGRGSPYLLMREQFSPSAPWFALDQRLKDLALALFHSPDRAVFEAFRRLESTVNDRCAFPIGTVGVEVFRRAFRGSGARLGWSSVSKGEAEGRAQLFEAAFMAFRNPRAHREGHTSSMGAFREFLLINELFLMEAEAVVLPGRPAERSDP
jgi:hypothetical protein